ncbi:hypothetical protein chiPu_0028513, partial [Chiloscyllium punctatum]|nr:hypothetical protein [Chiloscyllium punctatum]
MDAGISTDDCSLGQSPSSFGRWVCLRVPARRGFPGAGEGLEPGAFPGECVRPTGSVRVGCDGAFRPARGLLGLPPGVRARPARGRRLRLRLGPAPDAEDGHGPRPGDGGSDRLRPGWVQQRGDGRSGLTISPL